MNINYQIICDALLQTGMRVEEFWDFVRHPEWYKPSRRCIDLPKSAIRKVKCLHKERTVILTQSGCAAVEELIRYSPRKISRQSMIETIRHAAETSCLGRDHVCPKMFRKTFASWLMKSYPDKSFEITSSMGHTMEMARVHYVGIGFATKDISEIREFVKGWGE